MLRYNSERDKNGRIVLVSEPVGGGYHGIYKTAEEVAAVVKEVTRIEHATEEYVYVFCFDRAMHMQGFFEASHGTVGAAPVSPREVFMKALLAGAAWIILVHNHPSGCAEPSELDRDMTRRCIKAGELVDVQVLDHLIIGDTTYSMRVRAAELWD